MTVGEKIQELRKQKGLSQEDLGQMLSISRQTVSLWENNQTNPAIENLMRLKDIFCVSVDELLGCEQVVQKNTSDAPIERFLFSFSEDEINYLYKAERNPRLVRPVIISVFLILLSFSKFNVYQNDIIQTTENIKLAPFFSEFS